MQVLEEKYHLLNGGPEQLRNLGLVRPSEVKLRSGPTAGRFGKCEVEEAAGRLVSFFRSRPGLGWGTFTLTELLVFYQSLGWEIDQMFFGLNGLWLDDSLLGYREARPYVIYLGGEWAVTDLFVVACMKE